MRSDFSRNSNGSFSIVMMKLFGGYMTLMISSTGLGVTNSSLTKNWGGRVFVRDVPFSNQSANLMDSLGS